MQGQPSSSNKKAGKSKKGNKKSSASRKNTKKPVMPPGGSDLTQKLYLTMDKHKEVSFSSPPLFHDVKFRRRFSSSFDCSLRA